MLIDNKYDRYDDNLDIVTVWDFLTEFSGKKSEQIGKLDIVTGYFTIHTLSKLYEDMPEDTSFRVISSQMVGDDYKKDLIVDLLSDDMDISAIGNLSKEAKQAISFLERENVEMRAEIPDFCHAKAYLFRNNDKLKQCYYLTGSSNLTPAGVGLKKVPNVELNIAESCLYNNNDYKELCKWYDMIWKDARSEVPEDAENKKSPKIPVKEYFIRKIKEYFRTYSPEEIYYKILFELFNTELDTENSIEHQKDMSLLQTSVIWNTLFNYQQKGVISLIKKLRKYNGAILADAVGLGKTFSALAVIKYFETQNYTTVVLCPKKLEMNWVQYQRGTQSRFEKDEFDYIVRFHTDLQNDRLQDAYDRFKLDYLQRRKKILFVIDESHNLRNEKSGRYIELMKSLIQNQEGQESRDVKVLMLSATPINNGFKDVKGQFNLIAKGDDRAFNNGEFNVESLTNTFRNAQIQYAKWCDKPNRTIGQLIQKLPNPFFNLTDRLIVARTRKLIENTLEENLGFPEKAKPTNIYQGVDHFGSFRTAGAIYDAFESLRLTAYQPSQYLHENEDDAQNEASSDWDDDINREMFLVKMMSILFMKRLESSWYACKNTIEKVLGVHKDTLNKAINFRDNGIDDYIRHGEEVDDEDYDEQLVRRRQIKVSDIKNMDGFVDGLEYDVEVLATIYNGLEDFENKYRAGQEKDLKLNELVKILNQKKESANKKVLIFTAYADTAKFVYEELVKLGFSHIAFTSGQETQTSGGHSTKNFGETLQSFAPYSKLYKELDWEDLYKNHLDANQYYNEEKKRWEVDYETWESLIHTHRPEYARLINDSIDILIATDCLSEGQNLQDADLQINYDIHWNPVRLIQRFGRIDRIGSPNKTISCINFWPAKSFEDYLQLETRIQNRMSIMNLVGSETQELNDRYQQMVEDNPLQDKNRDKLLEELQNNSISDIESPQTLSLKDFSFETYRQELNEYYTTNQDFYRKMPNGVFSGFINHSEQYADMPESLVALVGYPKKPEGKKRHNYTELYIMCQPIDTQEESSFEEINKADVLELLRQNKKENRYIPDWILGNDAERIEKLGNVLRNWMTQKAPAQAMTNIKDKLKRRSIKTDQTSTNEQLQEEKFKIENFDLIVWEYVSTTKQN
ncbi:MAG: SNF2-related protein [Paludibacteraceae bacterium]|nr:SNF2-related protein [Paludibacteraceae bacterium]